MSDRAVWLQQWRPELVAAPGARSASACAGSGERPEGVDRELLERHEAPVGGRNVPLNLDEHPGAYREGHEDVGVGVVGGEGRRAPALHHRQMLNPCGAEQRSAL